MPIINRATENPNKEQWRLLSQFSYPSNIEAYLNQKGFEDINRDIVELIAGSMRQAEAYFLSAQSAPIDISPLLLYYGTTNLLTAVFSLLTNSRPPIKNHGMLISEISVTQIADVALLPRSRNEGALQIFCNVFSESCEIINGTSWKMLEIFGSIPDLKHDFENHYQNALYFTIPVEIVKTRQRSFERIRKTEFQRYPAIEDVISQIPLFSQAYLAPQTKSDYVILNYRRGGVEIGAHAISGRKYLQLGHMKNGKLLSPHQIILLYMGLFILGFLPRYHPELWNPFVRSDTTGEKFIIEKYLDVCQRFIPNLVLDFVYGSRTVFVNETEGVFDLSASISTEEIELIIEKSIRELRQRGEL